MITQCRSSWDPRIRHLAQCDWTGSVCPDKHKCFPVTFRRACFCDYCLSLIEVGSAGARCKMCRFDLCQTCSVQPRNYSRPGAFGDESEAAAQCLETFGDESEAAAQCLEVSRPRSVVAAPRASSDFPPPPADIRRQRLKLRQAERVTDVSGASSCSLPYYFQLTPFKPILLQLFNSFKFLALLLL